MKLFRLRYSPYARKVQILLDLQGRDYLAVEVPYGDRSELARLTGGYIYVPVLVDDDGTVITESRRICERLVSDRPGAGFVPAPLDGPIWAYHDWCDGPLEDLVFRIGSPLVRDQWPTEWERALYVLIKERKFGAGCVDAWQRDRADLIARANALLAPSVRTLAAQPFLFGAKPTVADAALYGQFAMLDAVDARLLGAFAPEIAAWFARVAAAAGSSRQGRGAR